MSDTVTVTRDHWQARRAAASLPPQQKVDPAQHGASHCDVTVTAESDRSHHDGYTQRRSSTGTVTVPGRAARFGRKTAAAAAAAVTPAPSTVTVTTVTVTYTPAGPGSGWRTGSR